MDVLYHTYSDANCFSRWLSVSIAVEVKTDWRCDQPTLLEAFRTAVPSCLSSDWSARLSPGVVMSDDCRGDHCGRVGVKLAGCQTGWAGLVSVGCMGLPE